MGDETIKVRIANVDGDDWEQNMFTCSVGEAAKRFTAEQLIDGTAERWMKFIVDFLTGQFRGTEQP